jgi:hypothetical protein
MTRAEKAYAAGLFDGEGYVSIRTDRRPTVRVTNTNIEVLLWLQDRWGGRISLYRERENRIACYYWTTRTDETAAFLEDILPYLIIKNGRASDALSLARSRA